MIATVSETWVRFDPSVSADFAENPSQKNQYLQGFRTRVLFDASVPKSQMKCNTISEKIKAGKGFSALNRVENNNVPIPGYLFSMEIVQENIRRRDKPEWKVDVCVALPDNRLPRGGVAKA